MLRPLWVGVVAVGTLCACGEAADDFTFTRVDRGEVVNAALPDSPLLTPDIILRRGSAHTRGQMDPRSHTRDGRITVGGTSDGQARLSTNVPEKFSAHINDVVTKATRTGLNIAPGDLHDTTFSNPVLGHAAICDPPDSMNPRACTTGTKNADCYDLTIVNAVLTDVSGEPDATRYELWGTTLTAWVTKPKSRDAKVTRLEITGNPRRSSFQVIQRGAVGSILEPVISGDGRIILIHNINVGLEYSVLPATANACDVSGWTSFRPISNMFADPLLDTYGVGRFQLRDSSNRPIPAGEAVLGAYPWIDRDANNLFFTQVQATLFYTEGGNLRARYPVLNLSAFQGRDINDFSDGAQRVGASFAGLWSHGKMVLIDGRINNVDYGLKNLDDTLPIVRLYRDVPEGTELGESVVTDINSSETSFNHLPNMLPRTPRDVVWVMNVNRGTGELAFDDYIHPRGLIVANMNAQLDNRRQRYVDGFQYDGNQQQTGTPHVQNAATSTVLDIPTHGRVLGGARIEPIAAGGVKGKGLWLDGVDDGVEFDVPYNASAATGTWFTSLWVNSREDSVRRRLLTFSDGSRVDILTRKKLAITDADGNESIVLIKKKHQRLLHGAFRHLAFVSRPNQLDVYVNGYLRDRLDGSFLRPEVGSLRVGAAANRAGVRGWIDEFKVFEDDPNPEVVCNHAYGTIVGVPPGPGPKRKISKGYPSWAHTELVGRLGGKASYERYVCEQPFATVSTSTCLDAVHPLSDSTPQACVRGALLFPEGPLYANRPRPGTKSNTFCRSCHEDVQRDPVLKVKALKRGRVDVPYDTRRQPFQTPAVMTGWIPESIAGSQIQAPPGGYQLDPYLLGNQ